MHPFIRTRLASAAVLVRILDDMTEDEAARPHQQAVIDAYNSNRLVVAVDRTYLPTKTRIHAVPYVEGTLPAIIIVSPKSPREQYVWVRSDFRRRGIGRFLVSFAAFECIHVPPTSKHSLPFWKRINFVSVGANGRMDLRTKTSAVNVAGITPREITRAAETFQRGSFYVTLPDMDLRSQFVDPTPFDHRHGPGAFAALIASIRTNHFYRSAYPLY
jgi:hypothetical protein